MCPFTTPFVVLSDVCESLPLDRCEKLFHFVEEHAAIWTNPLFFKVGKNQMLRMCNDLLRRLSSSQNTVYCGRIQLFLARLFPLTEKSALNLMSHFNVENVTVYQKLSDMERDEAMDTEATRFSAEEGLIDYNLYSKLWSMQSFFHNPLLCYEEPKWSEFVSSVESALSAFESCKLTGISRKKRKFQNEVPSATNGAIQLGSLESHYYAKFLTSIKLMNLQLSDSHFRQHILVQMLIMFHYLRSDVKFRSSTCVLRPQQETWITSTVEAIYCLLEGTPPDGAAFSSYIKHVLEREDNWIGWKNDGCPSLLSNSAGEGDCLKEVKRKRIGDSVMENLRNKRVDLGNTELTNLWNSFPDNLKECQSTDRKFVPQLDEFLADAILQSDPKEQVEEEYKLVRSPLFSFRALHLLAQKSPHFFQSNASQLIKSLPEFLEGVILQTSKDPKPNGKP